jgi:hypothetical protein
MGRLAEMIHGTSVQQGNAGWNCVSWAQQALQALKFNGHTLGTSVVDWKIVRDAVMRYVHSILGDLPKMGSPEEQRWRR